MPWTKDTILILQTQAENMSDTLARTRLLKSLLMPHKTSIIPRLRLNIAHSTISIIKTITPLIQRRLSLIILFIDILRNHVLHVELTFINILNHTFRLIL